VHLEAYVLGFTLAVYASGCILADRPRWTATLGAISGAAMGAAVVTAPQPLAPEALATAVFYLVTAVVAATIAHVHRHRLGTREVTARVRLEDEQQRSSELLVRLERLSHEDPLTGLANRRRWDLELDAACARARETGRTVSVVLVDLDRFKEVNDRLGHAVGDATLCAVGELLRSRVRAGDLVARIGGDELAVLLPDAGLDRAVPLAEQLRAESQLLHPEGFLSTGVSLSMGVAAATGDAARPQELVAGADAQLYRAKLTRNAVGAPVVPAG
jgi:diguanylate cyclase (GGDEF)-like protein